MDLVTGEWIYKHADTRPWDDRTDMLQYEKDYKIKTKSRLNIDGIAHAISDLSVETADIKVETLTRRNPPLTERSRLKHKNKCYKRQTTISCNSESSSVALDRDGQDDSIEIDTRVRKQKRLSKLLEPLQEMQHETNVTLQLLQRNLTYLVEKQAILNDHIMRQRNPNRGRSEWLVLVVVVAAQVFLNLFFQKMQ